MAIDEEIIQNYISQRGYTATRTSSGLYYVIDDPGIGSYPTIDSTVTVRYTGKLSNGGIFDQSSAAGVEFPLRNVILGWQEGIPYYREGGSGVLLIPSHLGYGSTPRPTIPANSVLIFELDLLEVN
jgi:FKBP-type peptidyl-prolyl cis-trans isomerase FkpA